MRNRWLSLRALKLHLSAAAVVAACLGLGWWQLHRALSGNTLSWVYTFEWPFFAAYALYMWWKLLHEPLAVTRAAERAEKRRRSGATAVVDRPCTKAGDETGGGPALLTSEGLSFDPYDESDPELAAYNRYLASLHAGDAARRPRQRRPAS